MHWFEEELARLEAEELRRHLTVRQQRTAAGAIVVEGKTLANFGANDYLNLAHDPRLTTAVAEALDHVGWGSGASPLVTGRGPLHDELEAALAEFEGAEAALLMTTGFAANVGTVAALAGKGDLILSDAHNHASLIDGCRLSGARVQVYPHGNVDYVEHMLAQAAPFRRRLIVTDGLFSMDGDLAPLCELAELAERHQALLVVDEAHATGVFGKHGRGAAEHLGVEDLIPVRVGTLSKALGSLGGFVSGSTHLVHLLANLARPYVFSTAAPEAVCAAGLAALRIVRDEPQRRTTLLARAAKLRERLSSAGWEVGRSCSQIIPVIVGTPRRALELAADLRERGYFVPAIRPPTVPEGQSLLRISLSYAHDDALLDQLAAAFDDCR
ncbi:MAG: 8-amino-7-oxononanoate synthase [Pirellulaceae bacterium]